MKTTAEIIDERETKKREKEKRDRVLYIRAKQTGALFHDGIKTIWEKSPWRANN